MTDPYAPMVIRPLDAFRNYGDPHALALDPSQRYYAEPATNLPGWLAEGRIFVLRVDAPPVLLRRGEYVLLEEGDE